MKTLTLLGCLLFGGLSSAPPVAGGDSYVYICISKSASKYHFDRDCSGLQKCTHEIEKTTKGDAQYRGYTVCLLED